MDKPKEPDKDRKARLWLSKTMRTQVKPDKTKYNRKKERDYGTVQP